MVKEMASCLSDLDLIPAEMFSTIFCSVRPMLVSLSNVPTRSLHWLGRAFVKTGPGLPSPFCVEML